MPKVDLSALLDRLNPTAAESLADAMQVCQDAGSPFVELPHWVGRILLRPDADWHRVLARYPAVDPGRVAAELSAAADRLPRRQTSVPALSVHVARTLERAWLHATLVLDESRLRTGHLLVAVLSTPDLLDHLTAAVPELAKLPAAEVIDRFADLAAGSSEDPRAAAEAAATAGVDPQALDKFTVDLTAQAEAGDLDPILGRDDEIDLMVQILMKRRQNNPILTGDPGVGKTAVVEGFAQRVVAGDVPPALRAVRVRTLDLGLLQAGAAQRGEFEGRLRQVIDAVQSSPRPIVLFIDEAHTLIGAGGQAGQGDAANLLKPALARGKLRTIAATTWAEYKLYFEKDPALARRFQVVKVEEPSEAACVRMLRGLKAKLERDHDVYILDETLAAAVRLPTRYLPARQLPDKAVSVLDAACASVAVALHATPPELAGVHREADALAAEAAVLRREAATGVDHAARLAEVDARLAALADRRASLEVRWAAERDLVGRVIDLGKQLSAAADGPPDPAGQAKLNGLRAELAAMQGERPLLSPFVTPQAVAEIVGRWTGIPVGRMLRDDVAAVLTLPDTLRRRVVGQRHALERIGEVVANAKAGLENTTRPLGVFLLVGPSGVGKTETALALAEAVYGGEQNIITINMSEFGEPHSVSTLKGSPPGYVGYGEGGVLTEAVRRRPYAVVLLDEIEKAHTAVHQLFFQVFDKGVMEDGSGRPIDFRNTIFLLTSNAGSGLIKNLCGSAELPPDVPAVTAAMLAERGPLRQVFSAAFIGRLTVVPYLPITDAMLRDIVRLQLGRLARRAAESHRAAVTFDAAVADAIAGRCTEADSGARAVEAILTHTVAARLSRAVLTAMADGGRPVRTAHVGVGDDGQFTYAFG